MIVRRNFEIIGNDHPYALMPTYPRHGITSESGYRAVGLGIMSFIMSFRHLEDRISRRHHAHIKRRTQYSRTNHRFSSCRTVFVYRNFEREGLGQNKPVCTKPTTQRVLGRQCNCTIEILDIECVLHCFVTQILSPQNGGFRRAFLLVPILRGSKFTRLRGVKLFIFLSRGYTGDFYLRFSPFEGCEGAYHLRMLLWECTKLEHL